MYESICVVILVIFFIIISLPIFIGMFLWVLNGVYDEYIEFKEKVKEGNEYDKS